MRNRVKWEVIIVTGNDWWWNRFGASGLWARPWSAAASVGPAALNEGQRGFSGAGFHQVPPGIIM